MNDKNRMIHINTEEEINLVDSLIKRIIEKNDVSFSSVVDLLKKRRKEDKAITFPSSILKNRSLGVLEAVTKYLKEELNLSYHDMASLLNRNDRPIWITYNKAKQKFPERLITDKSSIQIPLSIFTDRNLGLLENLTKYLRENLNLKNREIAKMLDRDNRTIWTCYDRAIRKGRVKNNISKIPKKRKWKTFKWNINESA